MNWHTVSYFNSFAYYSVLSECRPITCPPGALFNEEVCRCVPGDLLYCFILLRMYANIREDADFRTGGIFVRDTACFHCYSMNCDSQFRIRHISIVIQWTVTHSSVNHKENMPHPVRESASSLLLLLLSLKSGMCLGYEHA